MIEVAGSVLVFAGLFTRFAALVCSGTMASTMASTMAYA
ncbi:DoxX family membrane protein [Saccharomonospora xinjiangensis]